MAPRALGALLALVAAIAFVVSIVSSAWWAGPPTVNGRESHKKEVRVGLLGATGCNTGGDGSCEPVPIGSTLDIASKIELGAVGLAALLALLMAFSAWRVGDGRKGIARGSMIVALIAAAGGGVVLLLGPDIEASQDIGVPIGWGTFVFGGGVIANLVASMITRKLEPEPLRLKPSLPQATAMQQPPDVREMLRNDHDGLRPSQLGPEPMIGSGPVAAIPPSAPRESVPLIGGAPQLRPLYDPANQGYTPAPAMPALPVRAPTPIPSSMARQYTGQNTPPPERADTHAVAPPPPATLAAAAIPAPPRVKGPSVAPPPRPQSPSAPPRPQSPSAPPRPQSPSAPPPPRNTGAPSSPRSTGATKPPPLPGPGDPLGPPVDPFARTAPNDVTARKAPPPLAPPPSRATPPSVGSPTPRPASPSAAPPPAKPPVFGKAAAARDSSMRMPRAGTVPGPGTDPSLKALPRSMAPSPIDKRPSQPTIAHAVPPMPSDDDSVAGPSRRAMTETDDRLETAMRPTDYMSAVDPAGVPADTSPSGNPTIGDVTQTGVDIASAPPADEEPSLADELAAQQHDGAEVTDQSRYGDAPYTSDATHTPIPTHQPAPAPGHHISISTAPSSLPPPKATQTTSSGPTPACPQCEAPMAWVEEHLRFYCKSCRMYF